MRRIVNLLSHVTKKPSGCWIWKGGVRSGYGRIRRDGRSRSVHVLVYEQHHGPVPRGQVVRHICGTRRCIRPDHLLAGTQRENVMDSVRAGTHRSPVHSGESHPLARLSAAAIQEVRAWAKSPRTVYERRARAAAMGITDRHLRKVLSNKRWKGPATMTEAFERNYSVE